jgi:hypothetical protein
MMSWDDDYKYEENSFSKEQMDELNERDLSDEDANFILGVFVEDNNKSVLETYDYLINQFDTLGKTAKYVVAEVELNSVLNNLKQRHGFTDKDIEFLRDFCDNNIFRMKEVIDEDIMRFLAREYDKNTTMIKLITPELMNMGLTSKDIEMAFRNKSNYISIYRHLASNVVAGTKTRKRRARKGKSVRGLIKRSKRTAKRHASIKKKRRV